MKTEVVIKRSFMGGEISQKSKSQMFNATDLVNITNIKRRELGKSIFNLSQFLKQQSTVDFIEELQKGNERVIVRGRGRGSATWVHPLLFIDIALSIDPKLKVSVYKWLMDELLKYRNDSGTSYRLMSGAIYDRFGNKREFHKYIARVANHIRNKCGVTDWNRATEEQLKLRDKMHDNIALLCNALTNTDHAVRIGIDQALNNIK